MGQRNPIKEMLEKAQQSDLSRQRQIEAQKESLNRLLKARESESSDGDLIKDLCEERRGLVQHILELQAKLDAVQEVVNSAVEHGNNSLYIDDIREKLRG